MLSSHRLRCGHSDLQPVWALHTAQALSHRPRSTTTRFNVASYIAPQVGFGSLSFPSLLERTPNQYHHVSAVLTYLHCQSSSAPSAIEWRRRTATSRARATRPPTPPTDRPHRHLSLRRSSITSGKALHLGVVV